MDALQNNNTQKLISLTLPVACQICLGKVKEPVVCPNQHVFCSICMEVWLRTNKQCPTCRTPITAEQPCKKIVGSLDTAETPPDADIRANLRRTRLDLIRQDYEDEISNIQNMNDDLNEENQRLNQQVNELKALARQGTGTRSPVSEGELDTLMKLTAKLQEASGTYDSLKQDLKKLKQENEKLRSANIQLMRENTKLREESSFNKSPHKFSRYSMVALQAKVDLYEREIQQLKRALERSDHVIAHLRKDDGSAEPCTASGIVAAESSSQTKPTHSATQGSSLQTNQHCTSETQQDECAMNLSRKPNWQEVTGVKEQNRGCYLSPSKRKATKQHSSASCSPDGQWSLSHMPVVSSSPLRNESHSPLIVSSYSQTSEQSSLVSLSSMAQNIGSSESVTHLESYQHSFTDSATTALNTPTQTSCGILQLKTSPVPTSGGEIVPLGITVVSAVQSSSFEEYKEDYKDLPELPVDTENRFPAIARLRQLKRALIKDKEENLQSPQSPFAHSPASSTSGRASAELPHPDFYDMYSSQLPSPWGKPSMVASGYSYSPVGTVNQSENTELPHSTCASGMLETLTKKIKTEEEEQPSCS